MDDINKVKTQFSACTQNLEQSAKAKIDDLNAFEKMAKSFEMGRWISSILAMGVPLILADNRNNAYEAWCNQNGVLTSCPQGSLEIGRVRLVLDPRVYGAEEGRFALCYYNQLVDIPSIFGKDVDFATAYFLVADCKTNVVGIMQGFPTNDPGAAWKIGVTGKTTQDDLMIRIWGQTSPCMHDGGVCEQRLHGVGSNRFQRSTQTGYDVGIQHRHQTLRGAQKCWSDGRCASRLGSVVVSQRTPCPTELWIGTSSPSFPRFLWPVHKKQGCPQPFLSLPFHDMNSEPICRM